MPSRSSLQRVLGKWTGAVFRWASNYRNRLSECDFNSGPPDHEAARCPIGHDICENIAEWWKSEDYEADGRGRFKDALSAFYWEWEILFVQGSTVTMPRFELSTSRTRNTSLFCGRELNRQPQGSNIIRLSFRSCQNKTPTSTMIFLSTWFSLLLFSFVIFDGGEHFNFTWLYVTLRGFPLLTKGLSLPSCFRKIVCIPAAGN
jgi:hypothetical protein